MSRMPCNIEDGPEYEPIPEPEEPEFERDTSLVDTLTAIARLHDQNDILDDLYTGLEKGLLTRRQAE